MLITRFKLTRLVVLTAVILAPFVLWSCGGGGVGGGGVGIQGSGSPPGGECGPREGCWFLCFKEYEANPVYDPGSKVYYPCVIYDPDAFGNDIGDFIDNASSEMYAVKPYYKMWVGDRNNIDFAYSDDGINWVIPANVQDVVPG